MLRIPIRKGSYHYRKQKMKSFGNHQEYLTRIAKSLYYGDFPQINSISLPVSELASEIFSGLNKFSLNKLDIEKIAHLSRNGGVYPCLLVLALLYVERLKATNPKYLTRVSPVELFLISLIVGSKFLQDDGEGDDLSNTEWAELTGLSVQEINEAEKQFLDAIKWEIFVGKEQFWNRFALLETKVGLRQGCQRGWFTYTELNALLHLIDLSTVTQCFWNVMTACLISYTASVLALVGSALLVNQIPGLGLKPKSSTEMMNVNWSSTSPAPVLHNISSPLELSHEINATESELKLCLPGKSNFEDRKMNLKLIYLHLSPYSFLQVENLWLDGLDDGTCAWGFDVHTWSDYIRNFLLKNSVPASFYSVANF